MSDQTCTHTSSTEVYLFSPAVAGWVESRGPIAARKLPNKESQVQAARFRQDVLQPEAGLWEEAAFAALGLSGAVAIVAALV